MNDIIRFILSNDSAWKLAVDFLGNLRCSKDLWEVTIRPWSRRRSVEQNARLWALHRAAGLHTGYSAEEMHQLCKARFIGTTVVEIKEHRLEVPQSSVGLDVREFKTFMEQVEAFYASELGVVLSGEPT